HRVPRQRRQVSCAELFRMAPMFHFLSLHSLDDCSRPAVSIPEAVEVPLQVLLDLSLGFGQEPEVPALAEPARQQAHGERARMPKRLQEACTPAELPDTLGTPSEMIAFLVRRVDERFLDPLVRRSDGLTLVQRLGANLAAMVYPHQGGRVSTR